MEHLAKLTRPLAAIGGGDCPGALVREKAKAEKRIDEIGEALVRLIAAPSLKGRELALVPEFVCVKRPAPSKGRGVVSCRSRKHVG